MIHSFSKRYIVQSITRINTITAHSTNVLCVPLGSHVTRPGGSELVPHIV
jgi:hypothetical protein